MRVAMVIGTAVAALTLALGGAAAAGPEWCDDGSPPPNDWRFRKTGGPSETSAMSWLRSTTSGVLVLSAGINTLEGGVAEGMRKALLHAPSQEAIEEHAETHDDD